MIATTIVVAFVVFSCTKNNSKKEVLDFDSIPLQIVDNMFIIQTENGLLQSRMESKKMERYENDSLKYELFKEGFAIFSYNENGLLETTINSNSAKHINYNDGRETWLAMGNVIIKNIIKNETMITDSLYWDQKNELLHTKCFVKMYSKDGYMQGYGLESDQRARNTVILKPFDSYGVISQDTTKIIIDSVNFIGPLLKKE